MVFQPQPLRIISPTVLGRRLLQRVPIAGTHMYNRAFPPRESEESVSVVGIDVGWTEDAR